MSDQRSLIADPSRRWSEPVAGDRTAIDWRWRFASFALLLTLPALAELALAERKFGILGGGFGASRTVDGTAEWLLFQATLVVTQLLVTMIVWRAIIWAHGRRWNGWLLVVNAGLVATAAAIGLVAARYELMRYFSDALSFHLVRELGGGSLVDAALFVLDGSLLPLLLGAIVLAGLILVTRIAARRDLPPAPAKWQPGREAIWLFAGTMLLLPALLAAADRTGDVRYPLDRFANVAAVRTVLSAATDFDRDGYGLYSLLRDPAPFDSSRYPMALDVPGNGVDEDGIGGDLAAIAPEPPHPKLALPARPMNLILVVIESLRGDVLGKRVGGLPVAPNLEALARGGAAAPAYSHVGFTTASLKSIFTGDIAPADDRRSLFRELKSAGYRIGVISGQPESFGDIDKVTGMRRHADLLIDAHALKDQRAGAFAAEGSLRVDETRLLAAFDRHFGTPAAWQQPVFLYLNFQSPHFPYWHEGMGTLIEQDPLPRSAIVPANRDRLVRTYWNSVAWADHHLGLLLQRLSRLGVLDNSLVLVTGDHGESLFDDGFLGHGHFIGPSQNQTIIALNRPVLSDTGPIGLSDYRAIVVDTLSNRKTSASGRPVLMHVGPLEEPSRIGMVDAAGWTVFQPETSEWSFGPAGRFAPLDAADRAGRARADRLVQLWSSARWIRRPSR